MPYHPLTIIAGTHKGRTITGDTMEGCRPTAARVKQTVFDVLQHRFDWSPIASTSSLAGLRSLDVCAGWGSYGLEMLSRGGAHVTFVESHPRLSCHLNRVLQDWGWQQRSVVHTTGWPHMPWLSPLVPPPWDVIFVDPPYDMWLQQPDPSPQWLDPCWHHLAPNGVLVIESRLPITWRPATTQPWTEFSKTWPNKRVLFVHKSCPPLDPQE